MILAVMRLGAGSVEEAMARIAKLAGLPVAEARLKLTGVLPRVLLVDADSERLARIAGELEKGGARAVAIDPASAPADDERDVPHALALETLPAAAITLIQKGTRVAVEKTTTTEKKRQLDPARAILSGGLVMSKEVEKTSTRTREERESFCLVHRGDGAPDLMLREHRLDYRFLGADMAAASAPNLERTIARVRAHAPQAAFDDRCTKAAFVDALPAVRGEKIDLALHLVHLAHLLGAP
jgi:hypothetical protein